MKKIAFLGVVPHVGGTYTVFLNLRAGLLNHGVELRWLAAGASRAWTFECDEWEEGQHTGELVSPQESDERKLAHQLVEHLKANYDGAVVNVLCDKLCTNVIRYIPPSFPRLMLVHNITIGTYEAAKSIRDFVHGTVGVSRRIANDLARQYRFDPDRTWQIPNAVHVERFLSDQSREPDCLRILVLGRIENHSKGCFQVPRILDQLRERAIPHRCTIAGDGDDLDELKRRCEGMAVDFVGWISTEDVPELVSRHDAYLFPSNYEGFGISLVEAMAGGCVPVSASLKNVTDQIVDDPENGFLVPPANITAFADALERLALNPDLMHEMGIAARRKAQDSFSVEAVSKAYHEKLLEVERRASSCDFDTLPLDQWSYPRGLKGGLRSWFPESVKTLFRHLRERNAAK